MIPLELGDDAKRDETLNEGDVPEVVDDESEGVEAPPETSTRPKRRVATAMGDLMKTLIRDDLV